MNTLFGQHTIRNERVSDQIISILEKAIFDGELKQGDKLPTEEKIAKEFNVSKVSVREALREMETKGIVKKTRGKYGGSFISTPALTGIGTSLVNCFLFGSLPDYEIIEFRQILEPVLIEKAAYCRTDEDLSAMNAHIEECENELTQGKLNLNRHFRFHILIVKACHNNLFTAIWESLPPIFETFTKDWQINEKKLRIDLDYNYKFYDCILNRRSDEAKQLMYQHFETTKEIFVGDKPGTGKQI
ncbi:MAG: FadR family transcriptional regulator [Desulfobacteraceae bacterium]|nr:FadR family transcriptional regulator [Desulfobacteraceae bacterium]